MIDAATYDLNRYLDQQDRAESLSAEAELQTAANLEAAVAECKASDEKLGDAIGDWLDDERKFVRLALAIRCAAGIAGFTATPLYLNEIIDEAARAWGDANHTVVDENDVAAQLEDARAEA